MAVVGSLGLCSLCDRLCVSRLHHWVTSINRQRKSGLMTGAKPVYVCLCRLVPSLTMVVVGLSGMVASGTLSGSSSRVLRDHGQATLRQHCAAAPTSTPTITQLRRTGKSLDK